MPKSDKSKAALKDNPKDITELASWSEARELTNLILALGSGERFAGAEFLAEQLRASAVSVMSKISDGFHRRSNEALQGALEEAKGYLGQAISHLYLAFDQEFLDRDELNDTLSKAYTVGIRINSQLKSLSGQKSKASA